MRRVVEILFGSLCACVALGAFHCAYGADAPALIGQLALSAFPASLTVTPGGSRVLVQMQSPSGMPAGVQIIDLPDPSHPMARGRLGTRRVEGMALSGDGRRALLAEQIEASSSGAPSTYKVTAVDLSDPAHPRAAWERTVKASVIALAPDASAFAYARNTQSDYGPGEATLIRTDGGQTTVSLDNVGMSTRIHISPGARFLAIDDLGWKVEDLSKPPPVAFERKQAGFQSDSCLLTILASGHVLSEDLRAPRFGVYTPDGNLPRIAKLAHAAPTGSECRFSAVGRAGNLLLLQHANGTLYPLDLSDVLHPRMSRPLLLPQGAYAGGMDTKGRIFALRGTQGEYRFEIYDATRTAAPTVDWAALERVHSEALKIYGDKSLSEFQRLLDAVRKLEDAGAFAALDAPVAGVSNNTAAGILNDYAFLLLRARRGGDPDVRALLRRAIELDPNRRIAHLNLADALRQTSPSESGQRQVLLAEARANYGKYLTLGGSPVKELQKLMDDRLYRRPNGDICRAIVDFANVGRLGELIHDTAINIESGGRKLDFVFATQGTAHVPVVYAWDEADDSPVEDFPAPDSEQLWGGDALGLVVYAGRSHILRYRDEAHPVATIALDGGPNCVFDTSTVEQAGSDALEPELCARLDGDSAPTSLAFDGPAGMTREDVSRVYGETGLKGSRVIDIGNDGHPINIGELALDSGAGAGCDEIFFDQLDENAAHFQSGPRRDLLMALQEADPGGRYLVHCGNQARFFVYKGAVYFENKPKKWPPIDQRNSYHRVARIRGGQVEDVCHFTFKSSVRRGKPKAKADDAQQEKR